MRRAVSLSFVMMTALPVFLFCAFVFVFIARSLDGAIGTPISERVTIKERVYVPASFTYVGKTVVPLPEVWVLKVANDNGKGEVKVSQEFYEATTAGDTITVTGTKGKIGKKWILEEANKET